MPVPPIPVARYLVRPDAPTPPPGFEAVSQRLDRGLPQPIDLSRDARVVIVLPSGLASTWRDVDPTSTVARGTDELAPVPAHAAAPVGDAARPPLRLMVMVGGEAIGAVPVVMGRRSDVSDAGDRDRGVRVALVVLDWDIRAGSVRGAGDFGSSITLAWRRMDQGTADYSLPAIHPRVLERLRRTGKLTGFQ